MSLKEKLRTKQLTIGSWLSLSALDVCEIMAKSGFDWLVVDMEHTAISSGQMVNMVRVIDLCGIPALVRVGANDPLLIKHALDAGATGVIVPMVNSVGDAKRAIASAYYPPDGNRGVGLFRAQGYGNNFEEYFGTASKETVVILQIEHKDAVSSLEEMASLSGVDAFIIGPYDLSGSLGYPGDFKHADFQSCFEKISSVVKKNIVAGGMHVVHPDHKKLKRLINDGFTFIAYGADQIFLSERLISEINFLQDIKR